MIWKLICLIIGHNWNWPKMQHPERIFDLVNGNFACERCGFMWRNRR